MFGVYIHIDLFKIKYKLFTLSLGTNDTRTVVFCDNVLETEDEVDYFSILIFIFLKINCRGMFSIYNKICKIQDDFKC